ncbi:hypothetical protein JHK87_024258 [Glycine soja]|nr:hypothetical protein JHK87_024258 [Glycine soja]
MLIIVTVSTLLLVELVFLLKPIRGWYFEEVRKSLAEKLGKKKAKELISEAIYFISVGINDYMALIALYLKANKSDSFEAAFALDLAHNNALNNVLTSLKHFLEGFMHSNSNFYDWLLDIIDNPTNYGFKDKINACCGSGPFGGIFTCGGTMKVTKYNLCDNVEEYVWWDSIHGTEKINEQFSKALWNGPPSFVGPYNLKNFFNNEMIKLTIADVAARLDSGGNGGLWHNDMHYMMVACGRGACLD